jgi:hypothetical protein
LIQKEKSCPRCGVVPLNWDIHNKWCGFVSETKNTEKILVGVDGVAVRVAADQAKPPQKVCEDPAPDRRRRPTTPYPNRYKCPYRHKNCGENAVYCWACNERYEEFLRLLNDDR